MCTIGPSMMPRKLDKYAGQRGTVMSTFAIRAHQHRYQTIPCYHDLAATVIINEEAIAIEMLLSTRFVCTSQTLRIGVGNAIAVDQADGTGCYCHCRHMKH